VAQCIEHLHPFGVDVDSGVEAEPGRKDPAKVGAFISAARAAAEAWAPPSERDATGDKAPGEDGEGSAAGPAGPYDWMDS
jgi:hypothetical protein